MPEKKSHKRFSSQTFTLSWLVLLVFGALLVVPKLAVADTFTDTASGTWHSPPGVTSVTVEVWGAGGGGGSSTANNTEGGGGGGGEYRRETITIFGDSDYNYTVGVGGTGGVNGTAGGDTFFHTSTVLAKGGGGGSAGVGGAGGSGGTGAGANFNGGDGSPGASRIGGGGGGGAGTAGAGGNGGPGATAGAAGAGDGTAGAGGAGAPSRNQNGSPGNIYGGGGGGGVGGSGLGANGAGGYIRLTWTPPAVPPVLTTPTATTITSTSAILGATATDGEPFTSRGTVWGTTANPTGNSLAEGGTTNGTYSHSRTGLPSQTRVFYRGYATNASFTEYSPDGSFYTEPSSPASNVSFSGVTATGMTINWTRGTGGAGGGVLVLVKEASAVNSAPVDGTFSGYTANTAFGSGSQLGAGNYVVYKGTGSNVVVTGLSPVTTYHVAVYEFAGQVDTAGVDQGTNYTTAAIGNQLTPADTPTLTTPTAATVTATTATLGATVTSNGGAALTERGTVWDTTANPTANQLAEGGTLVSSYSHGRSGLPAQTKVYYRGYAINSAGTDYSPDGSFYTEPASSSTFINFTGVTMNEMTIHWTRGSGDGVIVLMKEAAAVDSNPVDGTYSGYTANTVFGSGTELGTGNHVVYKGTGTSVTVTGLTGATTYHVSVYEYAGAIDTAGLDQGTNYRLVSLNGNRATSADVPSLSNPTSSAVLTTTATFGATIDSDGGDPITSRGTCWDTSPSPTINCATAFGTSLGAFTYARSGLPEGTRVYFNGYANNASAGRGYSPDGIVYMEPLQPTNLTLTLGATPQNEMTVDWTIASTGDSDNYLVVMREASPVATDPSENTTYTANSVFGTGGTELGSSYVVYSGPGTSVAVTGLTESTTYYVKVYAYASGGAGTENYNLVSPLAGNQRTDDPPAVIPTVTSPTASAVKLTTATLGATVTSNGGEILTERGTCWDLTAAPTANCQAEGDVTETAYSHGRALLPEGSRIYYRGYATNSAGTGYSPDGTIYTEPEQPAILAFSNVTQNSMKIDWTINSTGNADFVLVVMRATDPVATDPTDGSTYTANATFGTGGTELGSSYVVYKGAGSTVTVSNLVPSTTYYVQIYAYAGNGPGSENYNLTSPLENNRATADPAPCYRRVPGIYLGSPKAVDAGSTAYYTVTVTNYDSGGGCGTTTFTVDITAAETGNTGSFVTPSVLSVDPCTISNLVEGGVDTSCVLEVTATGGATNGHVMNTVVDVSSGNHATQTGNVNTTINYAYGCDDCHGNRGTAKEYPTDNATRIEAGATPGNHTVHVDTQGYVCTTCHVNNPTSQHLNKNIEMNPGATGVSGGYYDKVAGGGYTAADATWAQDSTISVPVQNCLTTNCHGTASDDWGTTIGGDTCTTCHGVKGQAAPTDAQIAPGGSGVDTAGHSLATDAQVGAHQVHLTSASDYSSDIACANCHVKPAAPTDAGHIDDALPADLTWSALADASGTLTPDFDVSTAGACTNVYCHGANMTSNGDATNEPTGITPDWTDTAYLSAAAFNSRNYDVECARCHGFPPKGYGGSHEGMTNGDGTGCTSCHGHLNAGTDSSESGWDSGVFNDFSLHINGTVESSGCDSCHGDPPTTNDTDGSTTTGLVHNPNPTGATSPASAGAHAVHTSTESMSCGACHTGNTMPTVSNTVQMGVIVNNSSWPGFGDSVTTGSSMNVPQDGNMTNGFTYVSSDAGTAIVKQNINNPTCSVYCHANWTGANGQTTVDWTGGAAITNDCNDCHGGSSATPPTAGNHQLHAGNGAGDLGLACTTCHPSYSDTAHVDGDVAYDMSGISLGTTKTYRGNSGSNTTGGKAPSGSYGSCVNYCHGAEMPLGDDSGVTDTGVTWGATNGDGCGFCHGDPPKSGSSTSVAAHGGVTAGDLTTCTDCHSDSATDNGNPPTMSATYHINGTLEASSCNGCHGGTPGGNPQYWPDGSGGSPLYVDTDAGAHDNHVLAIANHLDPTITTLDQLRAHASTDAKQKAICAWCHPNPGAAGHKDNVNGGAYNSPTDRVDLLNSGNYLTYDGAAASKADTASVAYNYTNQNCTVTCHNQEQTPNTWTTPGAGSCATCHPTGSFTHRHSLHVTTKGYDCSECHVDNTGDLQHAGGRVDMEYNTSGSFEQANGDGQINYDGTGLSTTDTLAYKDASYGTCATAACHNNTTTPTWNTAQTGNCTICHTIGGSGTLEPTSGLHDETGTISGIVHNPSDSNFADCKTCHDATPSATHVDGTADSLAGTDFDASGNIGTFTAGATPTCTSSCHSDQNRWARRWHENSDAAVNATGAISGACVGCHGTFDGAGGFAAGVSLRHTGPDADNDIQTKHGDPDKCLTCHAYDGTDSYGYKWATHHNSGTHRIEISDAASFSDNGSTVGCGGCHSTGGGTADSGDGNGGFEFTETSSTTWSGRTFVTGPSASCTSCHDGTERGLGPDSGTLVTSGGTHMAATRGGAEQDCSYCHPMHAGGVLVLNDTNLGIDYTDSGRTGFRLGGSGTTGATEAEICWNCHDDSSPDVSEWDGSSATYDYGNVTQDKLSWFDATSTWQSAIFSYKDGALSDAINLDGDPASTHATKLTIPDGSNDPTNGDSAGDIGCSYCHDVHNRNLAAGDSYSGAPYLRGSWTSNPFPEDGAPRSGDARGNADYSGHTGTDFRGPVPRGGVIGYVGTVGKAHNTYGGWQIEQNNAEFTQSGYATFAGLCQKCHTAANIEAGTTWTGHNSVVPGFGGSDGDANIFRTSIRRNLGTGFNDWRHADLSYMGSADQDATGYIGGLRTSRDTKGGSWVAGISPLTNGSEPEDAGVASTVANMPGNPGGTRDSSQGWNLVIDDGSTQPGYHQFPCSKCHNPHASRLPRLMITNCLDVERNNWDDSHGNPDTWNVGNGAVYNADEFAYSPTAANCHRYVDSGDAKREHNGEAGWNSLTPW